MTDQRDTKEKTLSDKENLKGLFLVWDSGFEDPYAGAIKLLDKLLPHTNLVKLTIRGYGGTRFSSWVGDPSFSNLMLLELERCEKCTSLPMLGLLSSLKDLTTTGMTGLKYIGFEFYGENCTKPFQTLETLCFEDLKEWKYWDPIEENEQFVEIFPSLRELSIRKCPKLSGRLPNKLPSLRYSS